MAEKKAATPARVASQAAREALDNIDEAPTDANAYREAAETLSQAAETLRRQSRGSGAPASGSSLSSRSEETAGGGAGGEGAADSEEAQATLSALALGREDAGWARLPERLRKRIRSGDVDRFPEEYRESIRAYFRRLSEEQR